MREMKSFLIALIFAILHAGAFTEFQGHYSIIAPSTIRSMTNYKIAVSAGHNSEPIQMKVGLIGPYFKKEIEITVKPLTLNNVDFWIPDVENGTWQLYAEGLSGLIFGNITELTYADMAKPFVYIQTDKATYKPGDFVQLRVIFLDENTRPAKIDKPISVVLKDPAANYVQQFDNITILKGVSTGKLKLSDNAPLGSWYINVLMDGDYLRGKRFEVDRYILPNFQVIIDAPKMLSVYDEAFDLAISTMYTFGKLVKGKTSVIVKSYHGKKLTERTIKSDGKFDLHFKLEELFLLDRNPHKLKVFVETEEEITGRRQNASAEIEVRQNRFAIKPQRLYVDCSKPGATFNYSVTIKHLQGEPVYDQENIVTFKITYSDPEPKSAYLNKSGIATVSYECSRIQDTMTYVTYRGEESIGNIKQQIEPVVSTLTAIVPTNIKLGREFEIQILSPEPFSYFVYIITANENIIKSELIQLTEGESKNYSLKMMPTLEMMPTSKLYVHYIQDNEFKYYETSFHVEADFLNSISITAPRQTVPGGEVDLQIQTDPDSIVGLMAVDLGVLLLNTGNDFQREAIFKDILQTIKTDLDESMDIFSDLYPRSFEAYPGRISNTVTMTNAHHKSTLSKLDDIEALQKYIPAGNDMDMSNKYFSPSSDIDSNRSRMPHERNQFLETWFFQTFDNNTGTIRRKLPDTITTWVITGFSLNPHTGLALTKTPTLINTFKPFFLNTYVPHLKVMRGHEIQLFIKVFDYPEKPAKSDLIFRKEDNEFDFPVFPSINGETTLFSIRPKTTGNIHLKITAISSSGEDAIDKSLKVEPDGTTV